MHSVSHVGYITGGRRSFSSSRARYLFFEGHDLDFGPVCAGGPGHVRWGYGRVGNKGRGRVG